MAVFFYSIYSIREINLFFFSSSVPNRRGGPMPMRPVPREQRRRDRRFAALSRHHLPSLLQRKRGSLFCCRLLRPLGLPCRARNLPTYPDLPDSPACSDSDLPDDSAHSDSGLSDGSDCLHPDYSAYPVRWVCRPDCSDCPHPDCSDSGCSACSDLREPGTFFLSVSYRL